MIAVDEWLISEKIAAKLLLQVHDELVLEVHETAVDEVRDRLKTLMSGAAELKVPLLVEVGVGQNWDEAH